MNAICAIAQVPVRSDPSDKSEMITQILFGETFTVLQEMENWLHIRMHIDNYEGWIDRKQAMLVTDQFIEKIKNGSNHFITDKTAELYCKNDSTFLLVGKGSHLPLAVGNTFHLGHKTFTSINNSKSIPKKFSASKVEATALDYLNTPYLWGGRSIMGIDCSGLVQVVYHMCGLNLPRNAAQQASFGSALDFVDEALPGDLAFFDNPAGEIIHVGIIIDKGKIIHASGRVKIDNIDHNGIFSLEQNTYSHSLRIIKRL